MNLIFVDYFHLFIATSQECLDRMYLIWSKKKKMTRLESIDENVTRLGIVERFITYPSVRLLINIFVKC